MFCVSIQLSLYNKINYKREKCDFTENDVIFTMWAVEQELAEDEEGNGAQV